MTIIQYENITIRQAEVADAKQLAVWWNDSAIMANPGFPNGLGTTEEEVVKGLSNGRMVIEEGDRLIGECNYRNVAECEKVHKELPFTTRLFFCSTRMVCKII